MAQWLTAHVLAKFLIASSSIPPTGNCFSSDWIGLQIGLDCRLDWISNRFDPIPHAHTQFLLLLTSGGFNPKSPTI